MKRQVYDRILERAGRAVFLVCNLSKGIEEKGIKEGILSSIQNLMESMGWSAEQAMAALKIPESEQIQRRDYDHLIPFKAL